MSNNNNYFKKLIIPVIVLGLFILIAYIVSSNPPKNKRGRPSNAPQLFVDVQALTAQNFTVNIKSYGTVRPRTQSMLLPQVSGQIITVAESFRDGGFFDKGDILVELDDRDLRAEVKIAQASLFTAQQGFSEEQARVEQAKQDWQRLGNGQTPSELVLRKPQLIAAKAKVLSAEAQLDKAKLALERSKIVAPFSGRILKKEVDVGQVVSPNTKLAEIYAVDYVEIRLPIKNKDLIYLDLPKASRTAKVSDESQQILPDVNLQSNLVGEQSWQGKIVRTEGAIDANSQQLFVVAQINDPYLDVSEQVLPIKIGQYVSAKISGKTVPNAIIIPNKTIYQGSYVYVVEKGALKRQDITINWQDDDVAMIKSGLVAGQKLVLTPLGQVTSGTPVALNQLDGKTQKQSTHRGKAKRRSKMTKEDFEKLPKDQQEAIKKRRAERLQGNGSAS